MSCFIVSDATISDVIDVTIRFGDKNVIDLGSYPDTIVHANEINDFGLLLKRVNVNAYNIAYPHKQISKEVYMETTSFVYAGVDVSLLQKIKSTNCYLHQCNEGEVSESLLVRTVDAAVRGAAVHHLFNSKEYDEATWGR